MELGGDDVQLKKASKQMVNSEVLATNMTQAQNLIEVVKYDLNSTQKLQDLDGRDYPFTLPVKDKVTKVPSLKMSNSLFEGLHKLEINAQMNSAKLDPLGKIEALSANKILMGRHLLNGSHNDSKEFS